MAFMKLQYTNEWNKRSIENENERRENKAEWKSINPLLKNVKI